MTIKIPRSAVNIHSYFSEHNQRDEDGFATIKTELRAARDLYPDGILDSLTETRAGAAISYAASGGNVQAISRLIAAQDWPGVIALMLSDEGDISQRRIDEAHLFAEGCVMATKALQDRSGRPPPPPVNLDTPIR